MPTTTIEGPVRPGRGRVDASMAGRGIATPQASENAWQYARKSLQYV